MQQAAKNPLQATKELFAAAGLDYNQVLARGFDPYQMGEIRKGLEAGVEVTEYLDPEMPWTEMEEFRLELEQGVDLHAYRSQGFSTDRLAQIREGIQQGVDVSVYAKPEYFAEQMKEIREGLAKGLPVVFYQSPSYNYMQMAEIRMGLEDNVDISKYARAEIPYRKMRAVREALKSGAGFLDDKAIARFDADVISQLAAAEQSGVDIRRYAEEGYDAEQLEEIRQALEKNTTQFLDFLDRGYRGASLREIRIGLQEGLDVSHYASLEYGWEQMREIRLGLEARVDTKIYEKPLYQAQQMAEIRRGLEEGLDVSYYSSMVYSSREMRLRRKAIAQVMKRKGNLQSALSGVATGINTAQAVKETDEQPKVDQPRVMVSPDGLKAEINIPFKVGRSREYTMEQVSAVLKEHGVVYGVDYRAIADMLEKKQYNRDVLVARGQAATTGKDGYYEYFFDPKVPGQPTAMPDNSLLYEGVKYYEEISVGARIAEYHGAQLGEPGRSVLGDEIPAVKGKELPILKGQGIMMMEDKKSWCATLRGEIRLNNYVVTVRPLFTIEQARDPKENYTFAGSLLVQGNVMNGVTIKAEGDIVVLGRVDGARLECEGSIYIVGAVMGVAKQTVIRAGGKVTATTLNDSDIQAGDNVSANGILHCTIVTARRVVVSGLKGVINRSEIQAEQGVKCGILGSNDGTRTVIQIGVTEELTGRYQSCLKQLSRVESELGTLRGERDRLSGVGANEAKMQARIKVSQAMTIKEDEENALTEERAALEKRMRDIAGSMVRVGSLVHEGVIVTIDGTVRQVTSELTNGRGLVFRKNDAGVIVIDGA